MVTRTPIRSPRFLLAAVLVAAAAVRADPATFSADGDYRFRAPDGTFAITYPWDWYENPETGGPLVLEAAPEEQLPVLRVMVLEEPFWLPLAFATRAASTRLSDLGRDVEVIDEAVVDLPDGGRANEGEVVWTVDLGAGLPMRSLFHHRFHEGRWIVVLLTTFDDGSALPERLRTVARSLEPLTPETDG
jgi:hypothetical protein